MNLMTAIDLGKSTQKVIDKTRQLAKALNAKVWLLHVADPEPDFVGYDVGPQYERDAMADKFHREHGELQTLAKQLRQANLDATALLIQGPTVEILLQEINKLEIDMVIIGSHGKGTMKQLLVGSVSDGILRKADIPVVVIPTR